MKNLLLISTVFALFSTSAFASKARLLALGEDKDGSYFISDYRNIFVNPSELNSMSDAVVFEWGTSGAAYQSASLDTDNNGKAQGGAFYTLSNGMKLGVNLGDETDVAALTRMLASNVYNTTVSGLQFMQTADNVIDVFVAGKAAINWGVNALYTASKNDDVGTAGTATRHNQHAYAVRLGANSGAWNTHLLMALGAKSNAPDLTYAPVYKGKFGARLGGGYDLSATNKLFGMYETYSWNQSNTQDAERKGSFSKGFVGVGHSEKLSQASTLFLKSSFELIDIKVDAVGSKVGMKISKVTLPLSVGFEHAAYDWLVLRGSVVHNLWGTIKDSGLQENFGDYTGATTDSGKVIRALAFAKYGSSTSGTGGKKTIPNSTVVNAGATFKFNQIEVDGLIGATPASRAGVPGTAANTNQGILALDNLETRVGLTYHF